MDVEIYIELTVDSAYVCSNTDPASNVWLGGNYKQLLTELRSFHHLDDSISPSCAF